MASGFKKLVNQGVAANRSSVWRTVMNVKTGNQEPMSMIMLKDKLGLKES